MSRFPTAVALAWLLLTGSAASAAAAADDVQILASTYRVDLGDLLPGEMRTGEIALSNPGYVEAIVRLLHEGDPVHVETPAEVRVPPGASVIVRYVVRVPVDVAPGFHGEALKLSTSAAAAATPGSGTLDAGTAILFTWRHRAVGVSAIESPNVAVPNEDVSGALVIASTWPAHTNATTRLEWRDPTGALIGSSLLGPVPLAPNGTARVNYTLPSASALAGAQTLTARVADAGEAAVGGALQQIFHLGRRSAVFELQGVEDLADGNASVSLVLENTGDVPTTITPRLILRDAQGIEREILLEPVTLQPGERREVTRIIELPPGRFSITAEAEGAERALAASGLASAPIEFRMRAPADPDRWVGLATALGLVALGLGILLILWRRRADLARLRGLLRRRARDGDAPGPAPAATVDAFDALFVKLERDHAVASPPARVGGALLVDLETLLGGGGIPRLLDLAGDRRIDVAYAYARAGSEASAVDLRRTLSTLGFVPRVILGAGDFHIEMTLDAAREARAGRVIVVASADVAYVRLARALEGDGVRVDILAPTRRIAAEDASGATGFAASPHPRAA